MIVFVLDEHALDTSGGGAMKVEEALALLQGLTTGQIRAFMRARLPRRDADTFDVLTENVSHAVLVLASARVLTRLDRYQSRPGEDEPTLPSASEVPPRDQ